MKVNAQVVEITPQKARLWLQKMGKNRKVTLKHVKDLADAMTAGKWRLNGETICFDVNGKLIDGQHRLLAVIKSGVTILALVAFGVEDPNAFETYNTMVRKRNAPQILDMDGFAHTTLLAAIARRLLHWESTRNKPLFTLTNDAFLNIPQYDILDVARTNHVEIANIIKAMSNSAPYRRCRAGSSLITALIICNRIDEVGTGIFMECLKTGANLSTNSSAYLLRERLLIPPARSSKLKWETEVMALTIKAWNYFVKDKKMKTLRYLQDSEHPEKFPVPGDSR